MEIGLERRVKPVVRKLAQPGSRWLVPVSILAALAAWGAVSRWGGFPAFILPAPAQVWVRFLQALSDGSLLRNAAATLEEVLLGLLSGVLLATIIGYL